ncbi:hypothetical protein FRX31_015064, partial [Thalictrum thalictroides]
MKCPGNSSSETLNSQLISFESTSSSLMDNTQNNLDLTQSDTLINPHRNNTNRSPSETPISEIESSTSPVAIEMSKNQELAERKPEDLQTSKSSGEIKEAPEKLVGMIFFLIFIVYLGFNISEFGNGIATEMAKNQKLAERQHEDLQTSKSADEIKEDPEKLVGMIFFLIFIVYLGFKISEFGDGIATEMAKNQKLAERQHEDLQTSKSADEIKEDPERPVDNQPYANKESGVEERLATEREETGEATRLTDPVRVENLNGRVENLNGRVENLNGKMTAVQDSQLEFVVKVEGTLQDMRKISVIESHHKKAIAVFTVLLLAITILMGYNIALFKL